MQIEQTSSNPLTPTTGDAHSPSITDAKQVASTQAPSTGPAARPATPEPATDVVEPAPAQRPTPALRKTAEFLVAGARTADTAESRLMTTLADPEGRRQLDALLSHPEGPRLLEYALLQRSPADREALRTNVYQGLDRAARHLAAGTDPKAWVAQHLETGPLGGHVARRLAESVGGRPDLARQLRGDDADFAELASNRAFIEKAARFCAIAGSAGISPPGLDLLQPLAELGAGIAFSIAQDYAGDLIHRHVSESVRPQGE